MTKISKKILLEEFNALTDFCWGHREEWTKFCQERRNGKQSVEQLSTLVRSITSEKPWRTVISMESLENLARTMCDNHTVLLKFVNELQEKMKENQELVSDTV